jgi:hypothetical protein
MTSNSPVARPTLASGQVDHHRLIVSARVVASRAPWRLRGCLPGFAQFSRWQLQPPAGSGVCSGSTRQPSAA